MSSARPDQQPIARVVGRRTAPPAGTVPSRETRAQLDALVARCISRAPKGVFRYSSHDEMARDREQWDVDAMVETARSRG